MLEAVIEKAIKNGWPDTDSNRNPFIVFENRIRMIPVLFNHDFAKSYFKGEHAYCDACHRHHPSFGDCDAGVGNNQEAWEHHLTQAVLSEDPLLYYYEHLA